MISRQEVPRVRELGPRHESGGSPREARRAAGALESEILAILRGASEPLSPGDVRLRLETGQGAVLSYSTVVTIVSRLHAKGLLARQRAGRGFTYTPVDEVSLAAGRMTQALGNGTDHDAVLSRFVSGLSGRDARLLRGLLASDLDPPADEPAGERE
jgi:predicted transcriptional regulator